MNKTGKTDLYRVSKMSLGQYTALCIHCQDCSVGKAFDMQAGSCGFKSFSGYTILMNILQKRKYNINLLH